MVKSVLVLGCDERSGLTVIRSLGRAGIAVDVGWPTHRSPSKSRYVRNVFDLPDPNDGSGAWLDTLKGLLIEYEYDLVLPCDDRAIIPIQQHKVELGKACPHLCTSRRRISFDFQQVSDNVAC
jgi:hypothetical protein